jgi:hypothetical protein
MNHKQKRLGERSTHRCICSKMPGLPVQVQLVTEERMNLIRQVCETDEYLVCYEWWSRLEVSKRFAEAARDILVVNSTLGKFDLK